MASTRRPTARLWLRHLRRALGLERNALSRPLDRARSRALLLGALGLTLAALAGTVTALVTLGSDQHQAKAAAFGRHHIDATVRTPAQRTGSGAAFSRTAYQAEAAWTYPAGQDHTGTIVLTRPAAPGATARIWVSDTGLLSSAPPSSTDIAVGAAGLGLFTLGGLSVLIAAGVGLRLRSLACVAAGEWQEAWARLEPTWTGRSSDLPGAPDSRLG
ncbi:Rv1733c family protein [Kitasatospora sp. P5_F3]